MGKTFLFSPIGNTDPIKYFYDGSMLHICRYYQPDEVYLYLSREMADHHEKDNRYVRTIELLGERLGHSFQVHVIRDDKMVNVQHYDVFYHAFRGIIAGIEQQMETDDRLLVNMASGTPAMKSALLVMATLAEYRFLPIQVSTPKAKSNLEHEERLDYDVETNWELDEDNKPDARKRCEEVKCMHLVQLLKMDMIKKHLLSYDYRAALQVGKEIRQELPQEIYRWLEAADARASLDWDRMNRALPEGNGILTPVKKNNENKVLFEYALVLNLKIKRGEYADFIRAITPMGVDLLELVINQYCGISIEQYYVYGDNHKWNKDGLKGTELLMILNSQYNGNFKGSSVYSHHLNAIVQAKCSDPVLAARVQELVDVEQKVRNIAAHNIVSVTPDWVKDQTGRTVDEIMRLIQYLCECVKINVRKENWKSYDRMNEKIVELIDRMEV